MNVSIIGTGYVGLVTAACLAEHGHQVTCVDLDPERVDAVNAGQSPIHEDGLDALLSRLAGTRLRATSDLCQAVLQTDLSIVAVGTPFDGNAIDLTQIEDVSREIGSALAAKDDYHAVVIKSTVIPGTTDDIVIPLLEQASGKQAGKAFGVGMNPEFLREGVAVQDALAPDRIVLGGIDENTLDWMAALYVRFANEGVEVIRTTPRTAETIKYASNALFATLISFSNEIGNLCATHGDVDVTEVMRAVHLDHRLSPMTEDGGRVIPGFTTYLQAGCGFGGSCFPKDVKALVAHGQDQGLPMALLESVIEVNRLQPAMMLEIIGKHFLSVDGVRVALLGLAFKPDTDDVRESPALEVVRELLHRGADLVVHDPVALDTARASLGALPIRYEDDLRNAIRDAEVILLMTRWDTYLELPKHLAELDASPLVVDGRRMLDPDSVARYEGIGLSPGTTP
jgi:UDPglucose 6-dehydrogenase/GDP-mannose 6-dehydrogenase